MDFQGDILQRPDGAYEVRVYTPPQEPRVLGTFRSFIEAWDYADRVAAACDDLAEAVMRGHVH